MGDGVEVVRDGAGAKTEALDAGGCHSAHQGSQIGWRTDEDQGVGAEVAVRGARRVGPFAPGRLRLIVVEEDDQIGEYPQGLPVRETSLRAANRARRSIGPTPRPSAS